MAASKKTHRATLPDGTEATRKSARSYTHCIARHLTAADGTETWDAISWTGADPSKALARELRDRPAGLADCRGTTWGAARAIEATS